MATTRRKFLAYSSATVLLLAARQYFITGKKRYAINPETSTRSHHPDLLSTARPVTVDNSIQSPSQFITKLETKVGLAKGQKSIPESLLRRRKNYSETVGISNSRVNGDLIVQSKPSRSEVLDQHPSDYSEAVENTLAYFQNSDDHVVDNLIAQSRPSKLQPVDWILHDHEYQSLQATVDRLQRLQSFVGYANFNVISWDQSLKFARNYSSIGAFEKSELKFIEQIFSNQADRMGFYGEKVITQISSTIRRNDIKKIPATGHYLFKGDAIGTYEKIRRDIGDDIVLTSGIRGVVKQIYLFLKKTSEVGGNLSKASFSLAPPGHSFHAIGDFDVGKANFGKRNFTAAFAATDEFKKLSDLGYIDIRYPQSNPFGVRYEPWHIKVV